MRLSLITLVTTAAVSVCACAPIGSAAWCEKLDEKPKGDWTANEATDYTKFCVLKMDPDKVE